MLERYQFKVEVILNPTKRILDKKFAELKLKALNKDGNHFVLYCYYSGHGGLENTTKIILP